MTGLRRALDRIAGLGLPPALVPRPGPFAALCRMPLRGLLDPALDGTVLEAVLAGEAATSAMASRRRPGGSPTLAEGPPRRPAAAPSSTARPRAVDGATAAPGASAPVDPAPRPSPAEGGSTPPRSPAPTPSAPAPPPGRATPPAPAGGVALRPEAPPSRRGPSRPQPYASAPTPPAPPPRADVERRPPAARAPDRLDHPSPAVPRVTVPALLGRGAPAVAAACQPLAPVPVPGLDGVALHTRGAPVPPSRAVRAPSPSQTPPPPARPTGVAIAGTPAAGAPPRSLGELASLFSASAPASASVAWAAEPPERGEHDLDWVGDAVEAVLLREARRYGLDVESR